MDAGTGPARTALVLSAGMMFGAYQAGVWRSLAGWFRPDVVIGVSSGALNGWAIAGGCSPDELEAMWLDPSLAEITRLRFGLPPWGGMFDSGRLAAVARQVHSAYTPRMEVGIACTRLFPLRPRLFWSREITWRHLAASCSMLFGFAAVDIDGRYYVDGGFLGALPLWATSQAGVTKAVAIVSMPRLPSATGRVVVRALRSLAKPLPAAPDGLEVLTIAPSQPMGDLRDLAFWKPDNIKRWMALGRRDGATHRERLIRNVLGDNMNVWPHIESTG